MAPIPKSDLYACVAAVGRALEGEFQPRAFLDDLAATLKPLVPHDHLGVAHLADDGRRFSVFAVTGTSVCLPETDRFTTDTERPQCFPLEALPLAAVIGGAAVCVEDSVADPRFAEQGEGLAKSVARAAIIVPLTSGGRVIGAVSVGSRERGAYTPIHVERMLSVGRLIGPFVETMALLYREHRRRWHVERLQRATQIIGTTLDTRQILTKLGDAIRLSIEFDTMGVLLFAAGRQDFVMYGAAGEDPPRGVENIPLTQFSFSQTVLSGRAVLLNQVSKDLQQEFAGDRIMLEAGYESCLVVPMRFGDDVGGALLFGKHEPDWYDSIDTDVAAVVAGRFVLAIQHQRLADEQQRLVSAERRAQTLERSLTDARKELHQRYGFAQLIGQSRRFRSVLERAGQVAQTETTVLITGDSGTGKELVARAIHYASPRADGPFIAVNCAALPDTLLESELFGHERGAFTGADKRKAGRFELAAGGTLFLDEVGDLSAPVQVKLLRVLQEREFQRVGGTATLRADIRVITATNKDLNAEMAAGRFRSDLFYRLSVFNVHLPPLCERGDDVLLLADAFIRSLARSMGKGDVTLSRDACDGLRQHAWPGNIRELQNAVERALITCDGTLITAAHLALTPAAAPAVPAKIEQVTGAGAVAHSLEELEREAILDALARTHGQKSRAAALLGLTRFQLYTRLKRHGIDPAER